MKYTKKVSVFLLTMLITGIAAAAVSLPDGHDFEKAIQTHQCVVEHITGTAHTPIHINGNTDFASQAASEGWSGDGSAANPYIITTYEIDGGGGSFCIWIENTNVHFAVKNCNLYNATSTSPLGAGIVLNNVTNGKVENNLCNNSKAGIYLYGNCYGITIANNTVLSNSRHGIYIDHGTGITVDNNTVSQNSASPGRGKYDYFGIGLYYTTNSTVSNNTVVNNSYNGIGLLYADSNTLSGNNLTNNGIYNGYDISIESSNGNTIMTSKLSTISLLSSNLNLVKNNSLNNSLYINWYSQNNTVRNNIYQLSGGRYATAFSIEGDGNTIDGNQIYLNVSTSTTYVASGCGIGIWGRENSITNNQIAVNATTTSSASASSIGILVAGHNNTISQNNLTVIARRTGTGNPYGYGVYVVANNTTISQNLIFVDVVTSSPWAASSYWVYLNTTVNAKVIYNTINGTVSGTYLDSFKGIYMVNSRDSTIAGNTVFRDIYIESSQFIEITSNSITGDQHKYALHLMYTNYSNAVNNIFSNITGDSIRVEYTNNNTFHGNTIFNSGKIEVRDSYYTIISSNNIHNNTPNGAMLVLWASEHTQVKDNTIRDIGVLGGTAISLSYSCNNTISGNIIYNMSGGSANGIFLTLSSHWNTIKNNNVSNSNTNGIAIYYSNNNTVTYNDLCNNGAYGVLLYSSTDNKIQYNNFYGNMGTLKGANGSSQASDNTGGNNWNSNYWSNWDGSGNYPIAGGAGASDNSPLQNPVTTEHSALAFVVVALLCILPLVRRRKF
ncbi:MAG: right-handed parallel beta-helix repeat-containing protein [Thermoplasmata archaeon]|nr:right-handed parallel beta-helix repeat-containing protein [Thermoplasmata archaeon]